MSKRKAGNRRDLYQEVTDRILKFLEEGTVPWRNPIKRGGGAGWPLNLHSNKRYRGVNVFLLAMTSWAVGFGSDYWLTFRQAKKLGGSVCQGEKSTMVVFWKQYETKDRESGEQITVPVLRHYHVFNVEQCDGIESPDALEPASEPFEALDQAEAIAENYREGPAIYYGGTRAFYRPAVDVIRIPAPDHFSARESFYATLYHEMAHSTGHSARLDRGLDDKLTPFGSPDYSKEELVAEMGAAFLAAVAGISPPTIEQSAAYIDGWRARLKADKRLVVSAAGAGQKAADWILGERFNESAAASHDEPSAGADKPQRTAAAIERHGASQFDFL